MVIYLYGPDSYRKQKKAEEILVKYREKHSGLTVEHFSLQEESQFSRFQDFVSSQSLFGGSKLGIVHIEEPSADLAKAIKLKLADLALHLIIVVDRHLGKDFNFLLKKPCVSEEFKPLAGARLAAFIRQEAARRDYRITKESVAALIRSNDNLWAIINELEKLSLGSILEDSWAAPNSFVLFNQLKKGDLSALTWLLETEEPAKIFNIFSSLIEDPESKGKMADYDAAVKSGKLGYEEALLDAALSF